MHYIALLRGINVGKAKRIAMADLRQLIADLGYEDVRTLLNSGNVVFRAPAGQARKAAEAIEDALVTRLGLVSRVTVLDEVALAAIMAANPLLDVASNLAHMLVYIVPDTGVLAALRALATQSWDGERLVVGEHAVYLYFDTGVLDSKAAIALGKQLKDGVTSRNWNTLCKLQALCA